MGLETVELVLDVEERFGITIPDDEAAAVETVGDLTRLVLSRVAARRLSPCPTFRAFLLLRSDIRSLLPESGPRVRPRQQIANFVPRDKRRPLWDLLQKRIGTPPPELRRPNWLRIALLGAALVLVLIGLSPAAMAAEIVPFSLFIAGVVFFLMLGATRPYCLAPPAKMATFADAARLIAGTRVAMAQGIAEKTEALIREEVRDIIANALGVNRGDVVPSARFVRDLGAG